ncbi:MAG: RNA 2',3'-cyclic phosphodiesterase [Candidatus Obscuribacterales bacterium]|nr:RNA 2',3'-cyclic phosphodiesterase [Candidatus Obscuribacterales bacterium]
MVEVFIHWQEKKTEDILNKRLFIASFLDKQSQERISERQSYFQAKFECSGNLKLRFVRAEKLHLTWLFLGDCPEESICEINSVLSSLLKGKAKLQGMFTKESILGPDSRPQAFVLEADPAGPEISLLQKEIKESLQKFLQKPDKSIFRPHLTIFRFQRDLKQKVEIKKSALSDCDLLPFVMKIQSLYLLESHAGKNKDSYEILAEFKLGNELYSKEQAQGC